MLCSKEWEDTTCTTPLIGTSPNFWGRVGWGPMLEEERLVHRGKQGRKLTGFPTSAGVSGSKHFLKFGKESLIVLPSLSPILASCAAIHGSATWAQTAERTKVKIAHLHIASTSPTYPRLAAQGLALKGQPRATPGTQEHSQVLE